MMEKDFFAKRPEKLIEVWLFKNEKSFRAGAKKFFNDEPDTPYGYYSSTASALIMNVNGLGTLSHELVHPYMEANFDDVASWFNEGLASLFERPSERKGHIIGLANWRLPNLKKEIRDKTLPPLTKLLATTRDEFYAADWDAYAQARYLVFYLQEHGKLKEFYDAFHDDTKDKTGRAALEKRARRGPRHVRSQVAASGCSPSRATIASCGIGWLSTSQYRPSWRTASTNCVKSTGLRM